MNIVGETAVGETMPESGEFITFPENLADWKIEIYHKSGGLKKFWYLGVNGCPITKIEFELNKLGCGAGTLTVEYLDFPIDANDYINILYNGNIVYKGIVDISPDPKGGDIAIIPYSQRYGELLYYGVFTSNTIDEIAETIVTTLQDDSGILWNPAFIDTGLTDTFDIEYNYEYPEKIFDDLMNYLDDRYWGVDVNGYFYIRQYSDSLNKTIYYTDNPPYSDIEVENDFTKIEATRYQVLVKEESTSETVRIGEVGYSAGLFPPIELENFVRIKEAKYQIAEELTDAKGLYMAYAELTALQYPETITINNLDITRYFPVIGDLIKVQDREHEVMRTIIECENVTNWTGATLDTTDYVAGTGSIYFSSAVSGAYMEYNYGYNEHFWNNTRLGFMMMSTYAGDFVKVTVTYGSTGGTGYAGSGTAGYGYAGIGEEGLESTTVTTFEQTITIPHGGSWYFYDFEFEGDIQKIRFEYIDTPPGTNKLNIDRIQLFQYYRNVYEDNIVQANFEITPDNVSCDVILNEYNKATNNLLYQMQRKLNIIQGTQEA